MVTLTSPNQNGPSDSLTVTTFKNSSLSTSIVDSDSTLFTMNVQDLPADLSNSYTLSNAVAQGTGVTSYNLRLRTPVQLDGTLKLTFRDLTVGVPSCAIIVAGTPTALTCVKTSTNIVTVTLGVANMIAAGSSGEISISNLNLPSVAKTYSVEITAYSATSAPVLSTVQMVTFTSRTIIATAMSAYTVPLEASTSVSLFTHFAYPKDLPASPPAASAATLVSEIRLYFVGSGATFLKTDLGFGTQTPLNVPCKGNRGLVAYSGLNIICTLYPGPTPYIKVTNYNLVTADTEMSIIIPNFNNPTGSYFVTAKLLTSQNNVYNELAAGTMTVTLGAASAITRLAAVEPSSELCYTVDNRRVSQTFSLTFNLNADQAIADGNYLHVVLPFYDQGYIVDSSAVTCLLNGASMPCIPIMGVDQFLLKVTVGPPTNGLQFGASVQNFVTLQGLKWPRYIKTVGAVLVNVYSSANATVKLYSYAPMLQPWTNFFQTFKVEADKMKQGEANSNYKFTFRTLNPTPDGASIVIDLPIEYTLLASDPAVTVTYPGLPSSTTAKISAFYSSARVTVQNIGAMPVGDFFIYLNGVKNPITTNVLANWGVSLLYQTYLIETMTGFASFSLDEVVTPNTITLNSISSFPDNQNLLSDLSFSFTPRTPLKEGAKLSIIFPAQYKLLPSRPDCQVSGQLSSFDTCTTNLNTINVKLNSIFSSGTINLKIKGVKNPVAGETDKFILQTEYDGQIVDQVDTTTKAGKTIFITNSAVECFMSEFSFDPQNEGEIATYRFGFNPRIALESSMQIIIQFPQTFDNNLGSKVTCYALQNLPGNIDCKFSEKAVIISGFNPIQVTDDKPIIIEIRGITNPNTVLNSDAGTISLGALYTGSTTFLSFVQEAGVVETVPAAGWTFFQNLQVSNQFARFGADYLFNFTVFNSIPNADSGGMVLIDLPIEFSPKDSPLTCSVVQSKYGSPTCSVLNNRIYVQGNTQPYAGQLELTISKLLNPLQAGISSYFYIKSYDGFKKSIIERSFYNLDPFFFTYTFAGPALSVNNDNPLSIEAGTQSIDLPITLNELSSLDIIVKPTAIAGMSFIPFQVPIAIGQNAASIRISVAETVAPGDYLIEWKILNDLIPPYYSPIKPTTITVTNKKGVAISISPLNDVPFGGTSLPCTFSVANAPDTGFQISVNTKFNYKGIALDRNIIYFNSGVNEGSFSVVFTDPVAASTENLATGQVEISLGGDNADIYLLNTITLYFNVIQEDITPPNILSFSLGDVTQYSVTANIKVDDVVACYYMVG